MSKTGARVLVIDDEAAIRKLLRICLEPESYTVREAANAGDGLREAAQSRPELIILDLGLPDMDGLTLLKRIREWSQVPIIVLTVRESDSDKVGALDSGADDYLTKPFSTAELLARVRVALRHAQQPEVDSIYRNAELEIDMAAQTVKVNRVTVRLTSTEYSLLRLLARHAGRVVTHTQILKEVWGPSAVAERQYLRVYFGQLRKKLQQAGLKEEIIVTEPRVGYRLLIGE